MEKEKIIRLIKLLAFLIVLTAALTGIAFLMAGFARTPARTRQERQAEGEKWLYKEITPIQSEIVMQAGVCLKSETDFNANVNPQCFLVSDKKIMQGLNSAKITTRHNKMLSHHELPADIKQTYSSAFSKPGKPFTLKSRAVNDEVAVDRLKQLIKYRLMESSEIAKQLAMTVLAGKNPDFILYDFNPYDQNRISFQIGARLDYRSAQLKFFKDRKFSALIPHEFAHKAALEISYDGSPVDAFAFMRVFPCEQGEEFLSIWQNELEKVIALKSKLPNKKSFVLSPELLSLFNAATAYEPTFTIFMTEEDVTILENMSWIKLGKILNLKDLSSNTNTKFVFASTDDEIIDGEVFDELLFESKYKVKIKNIQHQTGIPNIAALEISPVKIDASIKAHYLIRTLEAHKKYVGDLRSDVRCQEAFGVMLELNEVILEILMPKSLAFLHDKFAEYQVKNADDNVVKRMVST